MSVLDQQSKLNASAALYAPASGGGGGSNNPNLQVSTLAVSSCMAVDGGSFKYFPVNDGSVRPPNFGFSIESSDGSSLYVRECANNGGLLDELKVVSTATGTFGLRTLVNSANAYVGYPSGPGGGDGGQHTYSYSTLTCRAPSTINISSAQILMGGPVNISSLTVSSINGAAPGGATNPNLTLSSLTVSSPATMLQGTASGNLYTYGPASTITLQNGYNVASGNAQFTFPNANLAGLGFQVGGSANGVSIVADVPGSYISASGNFALSNVSSLNGAAVPTPTVYSNKTYPFTTGADSSGTWQLQINSNTGGSPQYLTNSVTVSSSHSYLVGVNLVSGSNTDTTTTSITKLALQLSGVPNDITLGSFPGFANFWLYNGTVGPKTAIVRGASAIRLYGWDTSPTQNTQLYFDTNTGLSITDLGPSS